MSVSAVQHMTETLQQEWERQQTRLSSLKVHPKPLGGIDGMMEDLAQQIAVLESRLEVSNAVAQFLEQRAKQAQEEKRANESKAREMASQLEALKKKHISRQTGGGGTTILSKGHTKKLEAKLKQAMKDLQEKDVLVSELEEKCRRQKEQIEELQKQVGETEEKLNTSYIATLDELTGQIRELQEDLKESQEAVREAEETAREAVEAKNQAEKKNTIVGDTEEVGRTSKNHENHEDNNDNNTTNSEALERKCLDLESKLALTSKVAEFLQKKMVTTETDRDARVAQVKELQAQMDQIRVHYNEKIRQLENKVSDLDFKLYNSKRMLRFAETKAFKAEQQTEKVKVDMSHEIRDLKSKHVTQQRMAKFMEKKAMEIQEAKNKQAAELGEKVFDLEFKLTGSQRVCKFLETHVEKAAKEKKALQDRLTNLQTELDGRTAELEALQRRSEVDNQRSVEKDAKINELLPQVTDLKSRLSVMNEVGSVLQFQVKEMERETQTYEDKVMALSQQLGTLQVESQEKEREADIKISDLEFKLTDAKRVLKSLLGKYNKAQKNSTTKTDTLTKENSNLKERLIKAKQVVDHLQETIAKSSGEQEEVEQKVADLEFRLAQSARTSKFLESTVLKSKNDNQKLEDDVKSLEAEIASLKARMKEADLVHQDEISSLKARVSIADRVGEFVKQNKALTTTAGGGLPVEDSITDDSSGTSLASAESDYVIERTWVPLRN